MYCPNCGTENKEGSIYCNLCQEPLERYAPASPQGSQPAAPQPAYPVQPPGTVPGPPAVMPPGPAPQGALVPPGAGFGQTGPGYGQPGPGFGQPGPPPPPYAGQAYAGRVGPAGPPPPVYPGHPGYANYGPYPVVIAQQSTPGEATAALVLGIVGMLVGCLMIPSILAIVFGIKARNMIDASEGFLGGRGMATAGLTLGIVSLGIWTVLDIISLAMQWGDTAALALRLIFF
jgi:hypothetical protein